MSAVNLKGKDARRRLAIRREPHWQDFGKGCGLGFRRGPDTWVARWHNSADKKHLYNALREATDYDEAFTQAQEWWRVVSGGAVSSVQRGTVLDALKSYVADKREHGRNADDIERRIGLTVEGKALATIRLEQLTRDSFKAWRVSLTKGRANRTVNREVRAIVAGLTWAVRRGGFTGNPLAWDIEPLADDVDDEADSAATFLTSDHRDALIGAADAHSALYMRGLQFTGARPGELAAATVADYSVEAGTLTLRTRKGKNGKLRVRAVELSSDGMVFFKAQCKSKLPLAPIFAMPDGSAWQRHQWARAIRAAVASANDPKGGKPRKGSARIPVSTSAYSFRHSFISEALQVHNINPVTVARSCGTSLAMIEKYYFRFVPSAMRDALDGKKADKVAT